MYCTSTLIAATLKPEAMHRDGLFLRGKISVSMALQMISDRTP